MLPCMLGEGFQFQPFSSSYSSTLSCSQHYLEGFLMTPESVLWGSGGAAMKAGDRGWGRLPKPEPFACAEEELSICHLHFAVLPRDF